jgi:hypothetical protein
MEIKSLYELEVRVRVRDRYSRARQCLRIGTTDTVKRMVKVKLKIKAPYSKRKELSTSSPRIESKLSANQYQ